MYESLSTVYFPTIVIVTESNRRSCLDHNQNLALLKCDEEHTCESSHAIDCLYLGHDRTLVEVFAQRKVVLAAFGESQLRLEILAEVGRGIMKRHHERR